MMQSSLDFVTAYYALARMGVAIVPVNFLYKSHELSHIFQDSGAKGFIGMHPFLEEPRKVLADLPGLNIRVASGVEPDSGFVPFETVLETGQETRYAGSFPVCPVEEDDIAAIIYTSGTTGLPKGAMLTHDNLAGNAMTVADMRVTFPDDVIIGVLPLYHIFGQTSALNASIYLGLTLHLFRQFDPEQVLDLIEAEAEHHPVRRAHHAEPPHPCKRGGRSGPVVSALLCFRRVVSARGNPPSI